MEEHIKKRIYLWFIGGFAMPPLMWLFVCWYAELFSTEELVKVSLSPPLIIYVSAYICFATYILHRRMLQIDRYFQSRFDDDLLKTQNEIIQLPLLFIALQIIYCLIGPNMGLLGKEFIDAEEYFIAWLFGIPLIIVYSSPFFFFFVSNLEKGSSEIPMLNKKPFLDIKKRIYSASLISTVGNLLIILIFVYCLVSRFDDIQVNTLIRKLFVMGGYSFFSALILIIPFASNLSRQCEKMRNFALIVSDGDFTRTMAVEQRDEIGVLESAFNNMTNALNEQALELRLKIEELLQVKQELEKANRILQDLSSLDGLTGIPNRRCFDGFIDLEWRRAVRKGMPLSLIMIDIDHFKVYNDYYGHQAGDECLQQVGKVLKDVVKRPGDLVARYGGEEFIAALVDTDLKGAMVVAEMIRLNVEALNIPHASSPIGERVTISVGVATEVSKRYSSFAILITMADKALYQAKREGRNQIRSTVEIEEQKTVAEERRE